MFRHQMETLAILPEYKHKFAPISGNVSCFLCNYYYSDISVNRIYFTNLFQSTETFLIKSK